MISKEFRDSLTKVPQRNGTFGSKPLDCDHATQSEAVPRSNHGRAPRIGRPREVGRAGRGGAGRRSTAPRRRVRRSKPKWRSRAWFGPGFGLGARERHAWSTCVLRTGDWSSGRRARRWGGSLRWRLPACAHAHCVGLGSEFWRVYGRAQSQRQTQAGSVRGFAGLATAAHGVRGGGVPACCVRDPRVCHGLQEQAQNKEGVGV